MISIWGAVAAEIPGPGSNDFYIKAVRLLIFICDGVIE